MHDQKQLTLALRAFAASADPTPSQAMLGWRREGLERELEVEPHDRPQEYEPTGNARFDAIVRAGNPRFYYGGVPGYARMEAERDERGQVFDYIQFPRRESFDSPHAHVSTLAHELTHWTRGEGRVGYRDAGDGDIFARFLGVTPRGLVVEELTAEIGSMLLMDAIGEDPGMEYRAAYVANWLQAVEPDERAAVTAEAEAQAERAVNWLLSLAD